MEELNKNIKKEVLGVRVDDLARFEILDKIIAFLDELKFHQIATVNPEFILEAQKNLKFKNVLNNCDLNIADGIGIKLAFWLSGKNLKYRMAGADLMKEILKIANEKKLSIFLAINKNGLSTFEEIKNAILKIYPDLKIYGENLNINVPYQIQNTKYQILLCNFGAPHQELFINSQKNDTIRLAMGVGGSFDFLTRKIRRAPKFMRSIGLEWLWRLIRQPKRIKRIFNATVVFTYKIIFNKK